MSQNILSIEALSLLPMKFDGFRPLNIKTELISSNSAYTLVAVPSAQFFNFPEISACSLYISFLLIFGRLRLSEEEDISLPRIPVKFLFIIIVKQLLQMGDGI